ncbi:MAG: hypothetical protein ABIM89_18310 [Mycobacteriales bacterium]
MTSEEPGYVEVTIGAPVDAVWHALRDRDQLRRWHGWHFESDGGLDREIDVIYFDDAVESADQRTLEVQGGDVFVLSEDGERTVVRLTRAPRTGESEWEAFYEDITEGWTTFLQQLRFAVERHHGVDRRTLFFSGEPTATGPDVIESLGFAEAAATPVGDKYEAQTPAGLMSGEVWFRSDNQVGLTVEQWGDGLLVIGRQPASERRPHGGGMAVLTIYGVDGAAFAAVQVEWTDWWNAAYGG